MHDWGNYPGDEKMQLQGMSYPKEERIPPPRKENAPMPDIIYFVTWCDPKKYNAGPEQEYEWFSEEKSAFAKVGECHLTGYENVAMYTFNKIVTRQI